MLAKIRLNTIVVTGSYPARKSESKNLREKSQLMVLLDQESTIHFKKYEHSIYEKHYPQQKVISQPLEKMKIKKIEWPSSQSSFQFLLLN